MVSQNPLDYVNWRMAFIFLPAIIRGEWKQMGLYTPFMFSHVLGAARSELFRLTAQGLKSDWKALFNSIAETEMTRWTGDQVSGGGRVFAYCQISLQHAQHVRSRGMPT